MSAAKPKTIKVRLTVEWPDKTLSAKAVSFPVGPTTTLEEMRPLLDWFTEGVKQWLK